MLLISWWNLFHCSTLVATNFVKKFSYANIINARLSTFGNIWLWKLSVDLNQTFFSTFLLQRKSFTIIKNDLYIARSLLLSFSKCLMSFFTYARCSKYTSFDVGFTKWSKNFVKILEFLFFSNHSFRKILHESHFHMYGWNKKYLLSID